MIKIGLLAFISAAIIFVIVACEYAPYPDGDPKNYEECISKSTKQFTNPDPRRAMILTEKACKEKFPEH